jgi:hypothetical protein
VSFVGKDGGKNEADGFLTSLIPNKEDDTDVQYGHPKKKDHVLVDYWGFPQSCLQKVRFGHAARD